jgi:PIN domain nuclease of toxin-antitoxin system
MERAEVSAAPVLDTHAWLWWLLRDDRLGGSSLEQLDAFAADDRPYIADISIWEVAMLVDRRRLVLTEPVREWLETATHPRTVRVAPISAAIAAETIALSRGLRDPADRIIVATSRVLDRPLLTHDRVILRSRLTRRWSPAAHH